MSPSKRIIHKQLEDELDNVYKLRREVDYGMSKLSLEKSQFECAKLSFESKYKEISPFFSTIKSEF